MLTVAAGVLPAAVRCFCALALQAFASICCSIAISRIRRGGAVMRVLGTRVLWALLFVAALAAHADSPAYRCPDGSVEKLALLYVNLPIAVYVGTYTSEAKQSCTFTINPSNADPASAADVMPRAVKSLNEGDVRPLAAVLTSARLNSVATSEKEREATLSYRSSVEDALKMTRTDVTNCFNALVTFDRRGNKFAENAAPAVFKSDRDHTRIYSKRDVDSKPHPLFVRCLVTTDQFEEIVSTDGPVLQLRLQRVASDRSGFVDALFIPQRVFVR
jgi:hypothetical protein